MAKGKAKAVKVELFFLCGQMTSRCPVFTRMFLVVSEIFRILDVNMALLPKNTHLNLLAKKPFAESASLAEVASVKSLIYSSRKMSQRVKLDGAKTSVNSPQHQTICK